MRVGVPEDLTLPVERQNYALFVRDIAWFGIASAATSRFLSVFALRLGASPLELGLISALPAVVLIVSASFGQRWLRRFNDEPARAMVLPAFLFRLLFLLPAFAPLLPVSWQPEWLVASVTLPAIPQGIAGVIFLILFRQGIDQQHVASLTSARMLALNVAVAAGALGFGFWLESAPFPLNYQAMFFLAFAFALMSERQVLRVRRIAPVAVEPAAREDHASSPWRSPAFVRAVIILVLVNVAYTSIIAVTPLRLVKELGAAEGFMALFGLAELAAGALVALGTTAAARRFGYRALIGLAMAGTALAAIVLATSPSLPPTLLAAVLTGASWTAASVGVFGVFMESTPKESQTRAMVAYQQMAGLALFLGPMLGSGLVNSGAHIGLVMLLGAGLRLLAAASVEYDVLLKLGRASAALLQGRPQAPR